MKWQWKRSKSNGSHQANEYHRPKPLGNTHCF